MRSEIENLYKQLQTMYEMMQQGFDTQDVESAIFEYEDCVSDEDYEAWYKKYSYFV